jgi:hypothetical protein
MLLVPSLNTKEFLDAALLNTRLLLEWKESIGSMESNHLIQNFVVEIPLSLQHYFKDRKYETGCLDL